VKQFKEDFGLPLVLRTRNPLKALFKIPRMMKTFKKGDCYVVSGGNILYDSSSAFNLPYNILNLVLAKKAGLKTMLYGIGAGPLTTSLGKKLARYALRQADIVAVRDTYSLETLKNVFPGKTIHLTADPAVVLQSRKGDLALSKTTIGFAPRNVLHRKSSFLPQSIKTKFGLVDKKARRKYLEYKKTQAELADYFVEKYDADILFIPMSFVSGNNDVGLSLEIIARMKHAHRAKILEPKRHPSLLLDVISQLSFMVATRYHAVLLAYKSHVPLIGFAYEPKISTFLETVGAGHLSVSVHAPFEELKRLIDLRKQKHHTGFQELQQREQKNSKLLKELLQ